MDGKWIRKPKKSCSVVFVHGILSSGETCWLNENFAYWPDLLKNESTLQRIGIYIFTYQTNIFSGSYRIGDVVDALKERLKLDGVLESKEIIFVCHSMGGLVCRKFLVERAAQLIDQNKQFGLFLVASPSLGSDYASWLKPLAKFMGHTQADALRFGQSNVWLMDLDKEFQNLKESGRLRIKGKELIEDKFVVLQKFWRKQVVEPFSGFRYFGEPFKVPGSDHSSIAKPKSRNEIQHRLLCQFIDEVIKQNQSSKGSENPQKDKSPDNKEDGNSASSLTNTFLHQLRRSSADFVGREKEMTELLAALKNEGVAISGLQGMGGVGKTELALRLAEQIEPDYPDAQFYLDLKGTSKQPLSPAQAMEYVIRSYHRTAQLPEDESSLQAIYQSMLKDKKALLLMDNAAGREQIEPLIPPKTCVLIVTSRFHFVLPGLRPVNLEKLAKEEAKQLLLKIAPRIGDCADKIAELCDYLPLALEVAASTFHISVSLTPYEYVQRFSDRPRRLELLEKVNTSLLLSYELLDEEIQQIWRLLSVFPNTFDAGAVAALWGNSVDDTKDKLNRLISYSLVEWNETTYRYRLHDLVRVFADSRLDEQERLAAQKAHAAYYKDLLSKAHELYLKGGDSTVNGLALFDLERENIEAGQSWAFSFLGEDKIATQLSGKYYTAGLHVFYLRLRPREQINCLETTLKAVCLLKDKDGEATVLCNLGVAYAHLGDVRKAIDFHEQYLAIARETGNRYAEGTALGNLGNSYNELDDMQKASEFHEQHLAIAREIGDRQGEGRALCNLGNTYLGLGDVQKAIEFYEQDLAITRETGDWQGESVSIGNLGLAYCELGDVQKAIKFYEQHLAIAREIGDQQGEGRALWNSALAYDELGDYVQAIIFAETALEIYERVEHPDASKVRSALDKWKSEAS